MPKIGAVRIEEPGAPDVMQWQEIDLPDPGPGEVRVRHTAVGVNYIDTYHRSGLYPVPLPSGIGVEAAGIADAVGEGVADIQKGDRVAYATGPLGAYAEANNVAAGRMVKVPDGVSDEQAAAIMLKGMTVHYLLFSTYTVQKDDTILAHAAAGGVGLLMCQWANALGATVIGTVGSDEKAELARANGCHHPIVYTRDDFVEKVKELTGGKGVPVVYDSVGADTLLKSMDCLAPRGFLVSFGNASGAPPAIDPGVLGNKGSLFLTRPSLFHYTMTTEELRQRAQDLFKAVADGTLSISINQHYPLRDAVQAHQDLEGRKTTGATVLLP